MRVSTKRSGPVTSLNKAPKQDITKDEIRSGKAASKNPGSSTSERELPVHATDGGRHGGPSNSPSVVSNGNTQNSLPKGSSLTVKASDGHTIESKAESGVGRSSDGRVSSIKDDGTDALDVSRSSSSRLAHSPRHDNSAGGSRSSDKLQKRASPAEEPDRQGKRRRGDGEIRDDGDFRISDKDRSMDPRSIDADKIGMDEQSGYRGLDKPLDRTKDKVNERYDRDYRDRVERPEKSRDDPPVERTRDRSIERYGRERSVEKVERASDRYPEKSKDERNKDDRSKLRYSDSTVDKSHIDDRFHGQSLPPPPPLPPHMVPQSLNSGRREEDADRRFGTARHAQRLSPRHEEKERRRSEENLISQDDAKRRREEEFRERKREERDVGMSLKVMIVQFHCILFGIMVCDITFCTKYEHKINLSNMYHMQIEVNFCFYHLSIILLNLVFC